MLIKGNLNPGGSISKGGEGVVISHYFIKMDKFGFDRRNLDIILL